MRPNSPPPPPPRDKPCQIPNNVKKYPLTGGRTGTVGIVMRLGAGRILATNEQTWIMLRDLVNCLQYFEMLS